MSGGMAIPKIIDLGQGYYSVMPANTQARPTRHMHCPHVFQAGIVSLNYVRSQDVQSNLVCGPSIQMTYNSQTVKSPCPIYMMVSVAWQKGGTTGRDS
jgi:hypothetical protein